MEKISSKFAPKNETFVFKYARKSRSSFKKGILKKEHIERKTVLGTGTPLTPFTFLQAPDGLVYNYKSKNKLQQIIGKSG